MTFVEGKLLPCLYTTPNGSLDFSLYTHSASFKVDTQGGRFEARYTMLAAGKQSGRQRANGGVYFLGVIS